MRLEIVKLTIEGESQRSIAKQLNLSPSAVCRTLQRPHVVDKIQSSTQELHNPIYQQMMDKLFQRTGAYWKRNGHYGPKRT